LFGHALLVSHLLDQSKYHFRCLFVNISKVTGEIRLLEDFIDNLWRAIITHNFMVFKFQFVTKVFAMKGIKIELLGIAIIPLGIAVTTNNFWGYVLGVLGFGVAVVGCFLKDNH